MIRGDVVLLGKDKGWKSWINIRDDEEENEIVI